MSTGIMTRVEKPAPWRGGGALSMAQQISTSHSGVVAAETLQRRVGGAPLEKPSST